MKLQAALWILFLTTLMLVFQGCGQDGLTGTTGVPGTDGVDGTNAELAEGITSGISCLETALPEFYLKSLYIHEDKQEIHIKLKENE